MAAYVGGSRTAWLAENRTFLLGGSLAMLVVAVWLNIIGLNIGKWLQNAGGVGTYLPLMMIVGVALLLWVRQGSVTHFTREAMLPHWDWDTVNFWPQLAFAFAGLELVSAMSEEVKNPQRTFPRAIFASGALIALMYIAGTVAVLIMLPSETVDPKSGVFQAITEGSTVLRMASVGVIAALLVTVGNAGGVGSTVAGVARIPFIVGIDRYLPEAFGKIHPRWKTPYVSILVQAVLSGAILLVAQMNETMHGCIPDSGGRGYDPLFYSVHLHVRGGDQAVRASGPARKPRGGGDSGRTGRGACRRWAGTFGGHRGDCAVVHSAGGFLEQDIV